VLLALEPIPEKERRTEEEFNQDFARVAPEILGALLDGVVHGLRNLASVKVAGKPRMADFALWAEACTRAYWAAGTFLRAYQENVGRAVELMIEASDVAEAVRVFMASGGSGRLRDRRALPDLCLGIASGRLEHLDL
jgi:hypothetical protein